MGQIWNYNSYLTSLLRFKKKKTPPLNRIRLVGDSSQYKQIFLLYHFDAQSQDNVIRKQNGTEKGSRSSASPSGAGSPYPKSRDVSYSSVSQ